MWCNGTGKTHDSVSDLIDLNGDCIVYLPAKSATFGLMPCSNNFLIPSWSPLIAATCIAVSPRSLRSRERAGPCPVPLLLLGGVVSTWKLVIVVVILTYYYCYYCYCILMIGGQNHVPHAKLNGNANDGYKIRVCVCVREWVSECMFVLPAWLLADVICMSRAICWRSDIGVFAERRPMAPEPPVTLGRDVDGIFLLTF